MRLTDAAFEGAVERYGDTVFRLAYSYLKNRADAEDVMQETLLKLYLERKPFRSPEHERYWVVRVAVNESKKLLRSPWRRRTGPLEEAGEPVFDTPQQSELYQHVMGLPPKYRAAVYLTTTKTAPYRRSRRPWGPIRPPCRPGSCGPGGS